MSMGITVNLPDGVLMVADGMKTKFLAVGTPRTEDNNKIRKIAPSVAAIEFGLEPVTDIAVPHLIATLPDGSNPEQVKAHVERSVYTGWVHMLSRGFGPGVDFYDPRMKAALIVAGLAGDIPFSTGTLFYVDREKQLAGVPVSSMTTDTYGHIVLGGEEQNSQREFLLRIQSIVSHNGSSKSPDAQDAVLIGLLDAAAETIRLAATNPDIGGTIRYVCIRKGYPYTTGSLTADGVWICDVP
jgi:hypothetical protein